MVPCIGLSRTALAFRVGFVLTLIGLGGSCELEPFPLPVPDSQDGGCDSGSCMGMVKPNGSSCNAASECASDHCVDYVCCDSDCAGVCQTCSAAQKGGGDNGTCGNVKPGTDPYAECNGVCNEQGACMAFPMGASCLDASDCASGFCVDGVCCAQSSCTPLDSCHIAICGAGTGSCTDITRTCPAGGTCSDGLCYNQCTGTLGLPGLPVMLKPNVGRGGSLTQVTLGDMDGDGDLDLVVSFYEIIAAIGEVGHVGVYRNNGDGTFGPMTDWAGLYDRTLLLSDMNKDGAPDVILVSRDYPKILIKLNDGSGGFSSDVHMSVFDWIKGSVGKLVAADLNNDGYRDMLLKDGSAGHLYASINTSGTTFGALIDVGFPIAALDDFDAADLNADGKADLVLAVPATNAVHVRFGNGDGSFGLPVSYSSLAAVNSLGLRDLNADGHIDLVAGNGTSTQVRLNLGNGTFAFPVTYPGGSNDVADLDGDGQPDILGSTTLFNIGNSTFAPQSMDYLPYEDASFGDVDGDGLVDLARMLNGGGAMQVLFNQGNGGFIRPYFPFDVNVADSRHMVFAQLNGDNLEDLATIETASTIGVRINLGNGNYAPRVDYPTGVAPGSSEGVIAAADMNGDGDIDLVTSLQKKVSVHLNAGGGVFAPAVDYVENEAYSYCGAVADLNGDSYPDVARIVKASGDDTLAVMFNQGNGTLSTSVNVTAVDDYCRELVAADLNADGLNDLVIRGGSDNLAVYLNDGMGGFALQPQPPNLFGWSIDGIVVADINGDTYPDITFGSSPSPTSPYGFGQVCLNNGNGVFRSGPGAPSGVAATADVDGNGLQDILSYWYGSLCVYLNEGGGFVGKGCFATAGGGVHVTDVEGDGIAELVTSRGALHRVTCYP